MLEKFIPFVKEQSAFHARMADLFGPNSRQQDLKRSQKHAESSAKFAELAQALEQAEKAPPVVATAPSKPKQLSLGFDEIQDLPDELLQELSISDADRTDYAILQIIEECGGIASLDRILVGLYKATGEVMKRTTLTSRAYRMVQKGNLFSVPTKKGVYSTHELTEDQVSQILGS